MPVSGSNSAMDSISLPNRVTRQAGPQWAGKISTVSPRTRKAPRGKPASARLYCRATRSASSWRWSMFWPTVQIEGHRGVGLDRADAVDARDRGDDDDVVAFEQRARGRVAHAVDLLVDGRFLLDIGVGARDVGLGLVVVVIGDEILDRVVREEGLELAIELGGERLVGRQDQRRALGRGDHLGHGEGLARAGDAEQHLVALLRLDALDQLGDGGRLVARGRQLGDDLAADAALGLFRPRRPVRHPGLVAELLPAVLDQRRQRRDGGGDGVRRQVPTSSSATSSPATGFSPAAARSSAEPRPPIDVPRDWT